MHNVECVLCKCTFLNKHTIIEYDTRLTADHSIAMDQIQAYQSFAKACLLVTVVAVVIIYDRRKANTTTKNEENNNKSRRKKPPMAPAGLFKTVKILCSNEYPSWLLKTAKELESSIFRLNLFLPGATMVIQVGDPDVARDILTDPSTTKPEALYGAFDCVTGGKSSMATSNGKFWHDRRKGMAPAFSSRHVKRMNAVALEKVEEWIEKKLLPMVEKGQAFDVGKEMIGISMDGITETAFEYTMSDEEKISYLQELDLCLKEFLEKSAVNPLRQPFGLLIADRRRAFVAGQNITSLSLQMIKAYRKLENPTKGTIIDCIMTNDAYENDIERAADITTLLIAGHDTTAYSIAWILKELAKNPNEQRRLRDSLRSMDPKDWGRCEYLRKVIKEGIRLFPVSAGGSIRQLGREYTTKEGYLLPKRAIAFFPFMNMSRNTNIFENADSFNPSRWDNPTKEMNDAYMPFALGKQNCVGQSLANEQLHCILPRIVAEFDLTVKDEGTVEYFLTLKPAKAMLNATRVK